MIDQEQVGNKDSLIASTNKVDSPKVDRDDIQSQVATKIDFRNNMDYTFLGTGEEVINHPLGRIPQIVHLAGQDKAANIFVNISKSTNRKLYVTSSVAGVKARFVLA